MEKAHHVYGLQAGETDEMLLAKCGLCQVALTQEVDDLYAELCKHCGQSGLKGRQVRRRRGQRRTSWSSSNSGL